jgi:hypothetical protein
MSYKVCIPAAGTGSRLGSLTKNLNKSLIGIANKPTLSRIVDQFPQDAEFVIALGYKGELVREYVSLVYPNRKFVFVEVYPFEGPGSGLGHSLLSCKESLQAPFVFTSCDTLIEGDIPPPTENWMAYAEVEDLDQYRSIEIKTNLVAEIANKGVGFHPLHKAYIGMAGVNDFEEFWDHMQQGGNAAIEQGESYALRKLIPNRISAHRFIWHDTGNPDSLAKAIRYYTLPTHPNILDKSDEAIWFVDDKVIKYSNDSKFVANRVRRAAELKYFVPQVTAATKHMYCYSKVEGEVMSNVVTLPLFERLLSFSKEFWSVYSLTQAQSKNFESACLEFYREKTIQRVNLFYRTFGKQDRDQLINGQKIPRVEILMNAIDWSALAKGIPGRFHGDFHFENILWSQKVKKFIFLDWRQDFGGSLTVGDVYYDLAKLMHGIIVNHELIAKNHFQIDWTGDEIQFDFHRKHILVECERRFVEWLDTTCYDTRKVRTLTALIYLNIAPLHHHPYGLFLYALGKYMLHSELNRNLKKTTE